MRRILVVWAAALASAPLLFAGTVKLSASSVEAPPDGSAPVTIEVSGGAGIGAMHVELTYDASVLAIQGVDEGPALDGAMLKANHDTPGRVVLSIATAKSVNGSGALATVRFKVVGSGGAESAVSLEKCKAWTDDESEMLLPIEMVGGKVRVTRSIPWLPIGVGAGALAIVLLVVARSGRKAPVGASCPHCGASTDANAQFCPKCGKPRAAAAVCVKCGATHQGDSRFCAKCGTPRS